MSYAIAAPETMIAAATDLDSLGSMISEARAAAAAPTVAVVPAAADEVSASVAHLFFLYGGGFQALAGKASVFHEPFVQHLTAGAGSYASAEAANVSLLQPLTASAGSIGSSIGAVWGQFFTNLISILPGAVLAILLIGDVIVYELLHGGMLPPWFF
jgi:PE family